MQWGDERYVRLYCRDTITWLSLKWEGQAVLALLMRKVDRAGVFDLSEVAPVDAVAAVLQMPEEVVRAGLERLLKHKVLLMGNECLVVPNFIEAQEARMSDKQRAKECRSRRRDGARHGVDPSAKETIIYFVQSEVGGPIKIGRTDDMAQRMSNLSVGRPDKLKALAAVPWTLLDERQVHQKFSHLREKGEWFSATEELLAFVANVAAAGTVVTSRDSGVTSRDETITQCDNAPSPRDESSLCTVLSRTEPSCTDQRDPPVGPPQPAGPLFGLSPSAPPAPTPKRKTRGPSPKTAMPADFGVSPAIEAMCKAQGLANPHVVIREFRNKAKANGYRYVDWEAAFENWMTSAITAAKHEPWDWRNDANAGPQEPEPEPTSDVPPATPEQIAELDRIYREAAAAMAPPPMDDFDDIARALDA